MRHLASCPEPQQHTESLLETACERLENLAPLNQQILNTLEPNTPRGTHPDSSFHFRDKWWTERTFKGSCNIHRPSDDGPSDSKRGRIACLIDRRRVDTPDNALRTKVHTIFDMPTITAIYRKLIVSLRGTEKSRTCEPTNTQTGARCT
ncbi:condensin complex subunit 3 [Fusarium globosum]|uniref:Condensin complex subunit 3 n=1 Tax=Fusarium globosum TaxID=78864 RepID=A0A8H5XPM8_9HYPO|nr:condensin complex subunit 3 [Fusarium globosum]